MTTSNLGHRAARGTVVTLSGQLGGLVVQTASVIVLARLLTPTAYGLVAMVLAVVGVAHIFRDFGLSPAAIQAPSLSQAQRNNLFWLNTGIGMILTLATVLAAPFIQDIYHADHLTDITRVLSLTFLLSGAATQFRADLSRQMDFFKLAVADVVSAVIALTVAVILALSGASYWALVAQQLIQGATMLILVVLFCGWLPRRWCRGAPIRSFLKFGWNYVGAQLVNYAASNLDSFLIGLRFGAAPAGLYNRAFQLLTRPLAQLLSPSTNVALPTLAKLQHDTERFGAYILKGQLLLCYPIAIAMGFVAGAAEPIVHLVLGPDWSGATPILRFLTVAGAFQTISFVALWVYMSLGITDELRKFTLISASIRAGCVAAGLYWGVIGVAAGYGIGPLLAWPIGLWWLNRRATIPARELLMGGIRMSCLGCAVAACCWLACYVTSHWVAIVQILLATGVMLVTCVIAAVVSTHYRSDAGQIIAMAKKGVLGHSNSRKARQVV